MGRPKRYGKGRYPLLTDTVRARLIDLTKGGVPAEVAAPAVNITSRTLYRWLARGLAEEERQHAAAAAVEAGEPPEPVDVDPDVEEQYHRLWKEIDTARAEAAVRNVVSLQRVVVGGFVTREVTRSYRDQVTGQIVTETTKDYASPDWKAAAWFLERQQRGHFGKPTEQVEVSGPGGGPVQGELGAAGAAELAARLGAVLAERAEGEAQALALTAGPADDVVDAVIEG